MSGNEERQVKIASVFTFAANKARFESRNPVSGQMQTAPSSRLGSEVKDASASDFL
jgi:hypothetical protein